jgi:hypothetical protein
VADRHTHVQNEQRNALGKVASVEQLPGVASTIRQKRAAQWIDVFAHHLVTQRHIMVQARGVMAKEGLVTAVDPDAVRVDGIQGAGCRLPFGGTGTATLVGEAALPLGTRETQHIYEFAAFMARGKHLRIETADHLIARADVRRITVAGVTVADTFDGVAFFVPFEDITHLLSSGAE